jgi:hypothetical protein
MMKVSKIKLVALLLAVLVAAGGLGAYITARKIVPTILSANLESILSQTSGQPVSIGKSSMQLFPGITIGIRNVTMGTPAKPLLKAHSVKVRISLWHALFGDIRISHVDLESPVIYLDYEAFKKFKLKEEKGEAPPVDIHDGIIKMSGRDGRTVMEAINGSIEQDAASLKAVVLGGKTRLKVKNTRSGWKGTLSSTDMDLARISPKLRGMFGMDLDFDLSGNRTVSSLSIIGEHLRFPWSAAEVPTFMVRLGAKGNEQDLEFNEISVMTPLVEISGSGIIRNIMKGTGAGITLNLKSGTFDYEKVLAFIPTKDMDPWLSELLVSQIHGGMSRFSLARYEGTVQELITFDNFLDRIHVVEEVMGQSFGARPGIERVTGLTGQVVYSHGGIFIKNLNGRMRNSVLQKLNISFPGVFLPYWIINIDAKLDMAARDFLDTWNAAGMPRYVFDLFADISQVQAGRVHGEASFSWDQSTGKTVQARGRVDLSNCTYKWGNQTIKGHSGTVIAASYGAPLEITSRMTVGSHAVRSLNIVLADPFEGMQSAFSATIDGLLASESFIMDKGTTVFLKGTGTGLNISASADVSAESMTLFGTVYRMKGSPMRLKGQLKGPLSPKLSLSLTGEATGITPGRLAVTGSIDNQQTRIKLKGALPLDQFEAVQAQKASPLSGRLLGDVSIVSAKTVSVNGTLGCRNALLPVNEAFLRLEGRVGIAQSMLSGKRLRVAKDNLKLVAYDWSLDLSGKPVFKGNVTMDGLSLPLPQGQGGAPKDFKDFTARGHLKITNLDFYGIPVEDAQADTVLKGGVADFTNIRMQGQSVLASGSSSLDTSGLRSFDLEFSLKNVTITKFLENLSPNQDWIRGTMSLDGRLFGRPDSINGTVKMLARDGKIRRYALFSRIFAVLNVYKIIKSRDLELTSKNFPYNKIAVTCTFKDSMIHFDDLYLDSNSIQFSAVGDYSIKTNMVDAFLGVQPFESIDKAIHAIPLIGWVLTGDKGQLFIVSLKVSGNLDDPTVKFEPGKTISDPVKKSLIRALKLPSEILKDSRDLMNSGKKG